MLIDFYVIIKYNSNIIKFKKGDEYLTLKNKKSKGQKKTNPKQATNSKQKIKQNEPEIVVNFEEISNLEIENCCDIDLINNDSIIDKIKSNPEFYGLIFTFLTVVPYFLLRLIAFCYHVGKCRYNNVQCHYIKVDNDSILFITLGAILLIFLIAALFNKFEEFISKHKKILIISIFIIFFTFTFFSICQANIGISITCQIIISIIFSVLMSLFLYLVRFLVDKLSHIINSQIDLLIDKMNILLRIILFFFIVSIPAMFISYFVGYYIESNNKEFKIVNTKYVILYMNDEIAICSPYTEDGNVININKKIQKNLSLSDIEFEIIEFEEVEYE